MPDSQYPRLKRNGGKRKGAGRKPDWLKAKCQALIDKHKLLDLVANVAAGKEQEPYVDKDGQVTMVPVSWMHRLKAFDLLMERGFGKAVQAVDLGNSDGTPLSIQIMNYAQAPPTV